MKWDHRLATLVMMPAASAAAGSDDSGSAFEEAAGGKVVFDAWEELRKNVASGDAVAVATTNWSGSRSYPADRLEDRHFPEMGKVDLKLTNEENKPIWGWKGASLMVDGEIQELAYKNSENMAL